MTDLEAGPDVTTDAPASDVPASSPAPESAESALADLYDFGPPGEDTPPAAAPETTVETQTDPAAGTGEAATPAAPVLSDVLRQRAERIGYSPEFVSTFKDPVQLELAISGAERAATAALQFAAQQQQVAAPAQQQQAPQLPPPPAAPAPFDEQALRAALKAENYDESLAERMVNQEKRIHAQAVENHKFAMRVHDQDRFNRDSVSYMRQRDGELQAIQARHNREIVDRDYADFIRDLPEAHQTLVKDPAAKAQIQMMAATILTGMAHSGQQLPNNATAFKQAMYSALGEKLMGTATEQVRQEVKTHRDRGTSRPSSTSAKSPAARGTPESAGRWVEDFYRKNGMPSSDAFTEV